MYHPRSAKMVRTALAVQSALCTQQKNCNGKYVSVHLWLTERTFHATNYNSSFSSLVCFAMYFLRRRIRGALSSLNLFRASADSVN